MAQWDDPRLPNSVFSFASQAEQYPRFGLPGISYFKGVVDPYYVDCLLWRDDHGVILGILNHYPQSNHWEESGNVNLFIHPDHKRQGIGTALVKECVARWGPIDLDQQDYTPEGAAFFDRLETNGILDGSHRGTAFHRRKA